VRWSRAADDPSRSVLLAIIDHVGHEIWLIDELRGPHRNGGNSLHRQGLLVHRHGSVEPDEDVSSVFA
jgi:hypothetical protein